MTTEHAGWTGYHLGPQPPPGLAPAPASRIMVALDGTEHAEHALEVADALAAAAKLPLHLVAVRGDEADLAPTHEYLTRVARRAPRVSEIAIEIGTDVAGHLAGFAENGALVVLATHARAAVGEVLFGSVADALLRDTSQPVLLVGPKAGVPDPPFSTILVPDDGCVAAWRIREHAAAWAERIGAVPWAVQVLPTASNGRSPDVLESANVERAAKELGPDAEWEVLHGADPAEEIVLFARDHRAGMIAMTVSPRRRLGPDVAGGVALQVIRNAPCPVLARGRSRT